MYLSKLTLNLRSRDVRRDLASPYELHRTLKRGFATGAEPEGNRLLFRIERGYDRSNHVSVLIQTAITPPDWSRLPHDYYLAIEEPKRIELSCQPGQHFAFRLDANPVIRHKRQNELSSGGRPKHRREGLVEEESQRNWLLRRAEAGGFRLLYVSTRPYMVAPRFGVVATDTDKNTIPIHGVGYEGLLEVADPELFQKTIRAGIGPAKAFGFGMVTLGRPI